MVAPLRVLLVGPGKMGLSHGMAYARLEGFEPVGICSRSISDRPGLPEPWSRVPRFTSYDAALTEIRPDVVSINTFPDTHADFAIKALQAGAHVFVEKPLAETVADAEAVVATARANQRKLVIGYILRHHPAWTQLTEIARTLGKPLVMRMNLNQQSVGPSWIWHKNLMRTLSPLVDCGVHYVDVMCQMTAARPVRVHAIGARLSSEIAASMYNYGQLQVMFDDGSVGWYEAGWGPMMSEVAFFVKDVVGPQGSVSIVAAEQGSAAQEGAGASRSSDIEGHTKANVLRLHHAELRPDGSFARADQLFPSEDEPDHDALCLREQAFLLRAIREDLDLSDHMQDAVNSLRIVLAADASIRERRVVEL
jgi:predicted dehydrogenase